ncbi:hypothetical protein ABN034_32870 [Actinopolymorpha sp. B11F2]
MGSDGYNRASLRRNGEAGPLQTTAARVCRPDGANVFAIQPSVTAP